MLRYSIKPIAICMFFMQMVFLWGCSDASQTTLTFYDAQGNTVATAGLALPETLPKPGESFEGQWLLKTYQAPFPHKAARSGHYTGYVSQNGVSCDLNPGVADNNVVLSGKLDNDLYTGTWSLATDAGDEPQGTFRMPMR